MIGKMYIIKVLSNYEFYKIHQSMKNPLLKHFFRLMQPSLLKPIQTSFVLSLLFSSFVFGQTPAIPAKTECLCLNNATTATNGQYEDSFSFNGTPGHVWVLESPIGGFYHPASLPPPAAPILYLPNTVIPESSTTPGLFAITGKRVSGTTWSVRIRNRNTNEVYTVFSIQNCRYPSHPSPISIAGDINVCQSATGEIYALNPAPPTNSYTNLVWTLPLGGAFSSAVDNPSVTVNWGPTPGRYSLGVSGIALNYAGQPRGCNFSARLPVDVVDPRPFTTLRGDFGNCLGATERYSIAATPAQLNPATLVWGVFLDAAATIPAPGISLTNPGGSINSRTINWPNVPNVYYLAVRGDFRINTTADYCPFTSIQRIDIVSEPIRPLACNNLVQLSMNPSCELYFDPDQFLEGQPYPNSSFDIMIRDIERDTIIPNGTLGFRYVGKTLEIKIIHECTGNSCWGYAKIEDKSIPDIVCPANITVNCDQLTNLTVTGMPTFPAGVTVTPSSTTANTWIVTGFDRCSNVTMRYTDQVVNNDCGGAFSSVITRTWSVTDNSSNISSCAQTISVRRATLDDVIAPNNYDSATGPNASLEACGNWAKVPYLLNGLTQSYRDAENNLVLDSVPSPEFTGYPLNVQCLKAGVTYSDRKILLCGTYPHAYKLLRKWTIIDHCAAAPNNILIVNQLITVMDTQDPLIDVRQDFRSPICTLANGQPGPSVAVLGNKPNTCYGETWNVLTPYLLRDCQNKKTNIQWYVEFKTGNSCNDPGPEVEFKTVEGLTRVLGTPGTSNYRIENLPLGRSWIRYSAKDDCGNIGSVVVEIDVVDNQPPTPVCDRNSIVAVGINGEGTAGVLTFDDGSHDNCALTCMKIRRMDNPVAWSSLPCDNTLKFTCADIGPNKKVQVELYVEDAGGRNNTCMVDATVQDNIFPVLTAPAARTANCYEDFTSLTRFGAATVTDNCSATIVETRNDALNECGVGTITRTFTATDVSGNKATRTQVITVGNNRALTAVDIDWPDTYTTNVSCLSDIDPEDLPVANSVPRFIRNTECSQLAFTHEDIVFNFADNVCVKVLRQWKVVDWCQRNPFIPGTGEWTHTQLIMINNVEAPEFRSGCAPADLTITQVGECQANVTVSAVADDDCTPADRLEWSFTIDEGNNGTVEVNNGTGRTVNRVFPYGTHKITWTVKDGCKNVATCSNVFTIRDDKKPTPYCITEIGTVIMPVAKEVAIWASDFDRGSSDNCSKGNQITASFSATNRNDISRIIRCSDMDGLASKKFTFDVYFIDAAGNSDFCTVSLNVQDNGNICAPTTTQTKVSVKGNIYTDADQSVEDVQVELMSNQAEFPKSVMTGADGQFIFSDLPVNNDYMVNPYKNDDVLNGVSTLDLVLIQRHILGLSPLDSPYKLIAADVNNSAKITASDLVDLRKVILGIHDEFNNNKSWRFIDAGYKFADPKNPFPYTEMAEMSNVDKNMAGKDFVAVKVGDINGSVKASRFNNAEVSNRSVMNFHQNKITAKAGDIVAVHISADDLQSLVGMQMSLSFDKQMVELMEAGSEKISVYEQNFNYNNLSNGLIHLSWNHFAPVKVQDNMFSFKFKMLKDADNHTILKLYNAGLHPEAYTQSNDEFAAHRISLEARSGSESVIEAFEVYQNIPNPFNASTTIGFTLPETSDVSLKIYDVTGKVLLQQNGTYKKGYNSIQLDANSLNHTGVLYYQIETSKHSATRKMIIIK